MQRPMPKRHPPELKFQQHIADFLIREHKYGVLEQGDITDTDHFIFFRNGLPIVALEVKHEKNQTVHDAVAQFANRDHACRMFQHPFLYLAADTADVMAATDPCREESFHWHNTGLTNEPITKGEYPVEFLYREVLSRERLLEALA